MDPPKESSEIIPEVGRPRKSPEETSSVQIKKHKGDICFEAVESLRKALEETSSQVKRSEFIFGIGSPPKALEETSPQVKTKARRFESSLLPMKTYETVESLRRALEETSPQVKRSIGSPQKALEETSPQVKTTGRFKTSLLPMKTYETVESLRRALEGTSPQVKRSIGSPQKALEETSPQVKRRVGRPKKTTKETSSPQVKKISEVGRPQKSPEETSVQIKKRKGDIGFEGGKKLSAMPYSSVLYREKCIAIFNPSKFVNVLPGQESENQPDYIYQKPTLYRLDYTFSRPWLAEELEEPLNNDPSPLLRCLEIRDKEHQCENVSDKHDAPMVQLEFECEGHCKEDEKCLFCCE